VRNQRISFHLSESDATRSFSSLSADDDKKKQVIVFTRMSGVFVVLQSKYEP